MLSITNKFLFIHVPKTGGNSIQNILRNYSEDDVVVLAKHQDGIERFEVRNKNYDITKHSPLSHYKSIIEPSLYNSLFKFSTIRNPWDMLISYYFSPHRGRVEWDKNHFIQFIKNNVFPMRHFLSLTDEDDFALNVDHIMKFENLSQQFHEITKLLNIEQTDLPHKNKSKKEHYSYYYDKELIDFIQEKFLEDIALGDYEFKKL